MTALRFDNVTPALFGMSKVVSEDSARRALLKLEQMAARSWQQGHLGAYWAPLLYEPWVLDIDTTIKTIYGHQEGAEVGYNPHKTKNVKQLVRMLETMGGWCNAGQGFEGAEGMLQLAGWSYKRRVIVLRRSCETKARENKAALPLLALAGEYIVENGGYEYMVLVTSLPYGIEETAQLYRDRAESENPFDELKNQWGWSGFTTHDFERCQIMARYIALIYNWWSLFVRLLCADKHSEAITSRPMMLAGVARQTMHAGQKKLTISLNHGKATEIKDMAEAACQFLKGLIEAAEQLTQPERWRRILSRIFIKFLDGRLLAGPESLLMSG
jgi:hypothetical protein